MDCIAQYCSGLIALMETVTTWQADWDWDVRFHQEAFSKPLGRTSDLNGSFESREQQESRKRFELCPCNGREILAKYSQTLSRASWFNTILNKVAATLFSVHQRSIFFTGDARAEVDDEKFYRRALYLEVKNNGFL